MSFIFFKLKSFKESDETNKYFLQKIPFKESFPIIIIRLLNSTYKDCVFIILHFLMKKEYSILEI